MSKRRFGATRGAALWLGPQLVQSFGCRDARVLAERRPQLPRLTMVMWSVSYSVFWVDSVSEPSVLRYIEHRWAALAA
jgi:hypothetical protein